MSNGFNVSKDTNYAFSIHSNLVLRALFYPSSSIHSAFNRLGIYPNPCSDYLHLEFELSHYQIMNSEGQRIQEGMEQTIDVRALLQGIYLLEILDASGNKQRFKFIKA